MNPDHVSIEPIRLFGLPIKPREHCRHIVNIDANGKCPFSAQKKSLLVLSVWTGTIAYPVLLSQATQNQKALCGDSSTKSGCVQTGGVGLSLNLRHPAPKSKRKQGGDRLPRRPDLDFGPGAYSACPSGGNETPGVPRGRGRERIEDRPKCASWRGAGGTLDRIYSTRAEHVELLALRLDASRREPYPFPVVRALVASALRPRLDGPAPIL